MMEFASSHPCHELDSECQFTPLTMAAALPNGELCALALIDYCIGNAAECSKAPCVLIAQPQDRLIIFGAEYLHVRFTDRLLRLFLLQTSPETFNQVLFDLLFSTIDFHAKSANDLPNRYLEMLIMIFKFVPKLRIHEVLVLAVSRKHMVTVEMLLLYIRTNDLDRRGVHNYHDVCSWLESNIWTTVLYSSITGGSNEIVIALLEYIIERHKMLLPGHLSSIIPDLMLVEHAFQSNSIASTTLLDIIIETSQVALFQLLLLTYANQLRPHLDKVVSMCQKSSENMETLVAIANKSLAKA